MNLIKNLKLNIQNCPSPLANASGAVLLTVVVVIIIIGLAGVAIFSMTSTSTFTQLHAQNAGKAFFLAESGFRVVASEYNNAEDDEKLDVLEGLHGTTLNLPGNAGQFDVKLYPYWFYVDDPYTAGNTSISVKIPGGTPLINPIDTDSPTRITLPRSGYLKVQGKSQLAKITDVSPENPADHAQISFTIESPGFPFGIQADEEVFLVYTDNNTISQTVFQDGSIDFPGTNLVAQILPAQNGSFRVYNEDNDKMDYTYLEKVPAVVVPGNLPTTITLNGIQHQNDDTPSLFDFNIDNTSEIYFGRNLAVFSTSTVGAGNMAAKKTVGNYTDVGVDGGFFAGRDTISFDEDIGDFTPTMNDPNPSLGQPIEIDIGAGTIQLGGDLPGGYGSVWYKGNSDIADCLEGECLLGRGFRAYFEFTFDDTDDSDESTIYGDGFTFSLVSGVNYTLGDTGLGGEYMGYAGPGLSSDGLQPPKLAVEIDTYPNPGAGSVCGSDSRYDDEPVANHAALVYWGEETVGSLDAQGGYIRIGSAAPTDDDDEDWSSSQGTISFWFKRDTIFYGDGNASGDRLWGQSANMETRFNNTGSNFYLDWGSGGNAEGAINAANPFNGAGTWYFIAITWDDATDQLIVYWGNETTLISPLVPAGDPAMANLAWTGDMSAVGLIAENLFLNSSGGNGSKNFAVDGKGSDLRYYDVARTFEDIQDDYEQRLAGSEVNYNDLQAYFPLQADLLDADLPSPGISAVAMGATGWSSDTVSVFDCDTGSALARATYDDNRHGAGGTTSTTLQNSLNSNSGNGYDGYHQVTGFSPNWLEDGSLHRFRMELIRPLIEADDGDPDTLYDYQVKIWIDCATCSAAELAQFEDVKADFSASLPTIEKTINRGNSLKINPADHLDLIRVLFGFTQGTGGATQNITLRNLELYFLKEYPASYPAGW